MAERRGDAANNGVQIITATAASARDRADTRAFE